MFQNNMCGGGNKHFGSCYIKNNHKNKRNKDEFKFHLKKFACSFTKIGTHTILKGTSLQLLKVCIRQKI